MAVQITRQGDSAVTFTDPDDFAAAHAADKWLRDRGFSCGSMQGYEPRAIWFGECYISKWRGLNAADKREMHAKMTGDQRNGPVTISLCRGATNDAKVAFASELEGGAA